MGSFGLFKNVLKSNKIYQRTRFTYVVISSISEVFGDLVEPDLSQSAESDFHSYDDELCDKREKSDRQRERTCLNCVLLPSVLMQKQKVRALSQQAVRVLLHPGLLSDKKVE